MLAMQKAICFVLALAVSTASEIGLSTDWAQTIERLKLLPEWESEKQSPDTQASERNVGTFHFDVGFEGKPEKLTVHNLMPHDIDVLGALGDSITAATGAGADYLPGLAIQFRGISWLAGGDETLETSITLTSIYYVTDVCLWGYGFACVDKIKGYSSGNGLGYVVREEDWYNVAVPGGRAHDMTDQANHLVQRLKNDTRTNFENDWKLISIFIGGNDLCAIDRDPDGASPETYVNEIKKALDIFHAELPRTIVQIAQIMEIYLLPQVSDADNAYPLCKLTQRLFCGYVAQAEGEVQETLKEINWQYQSQMEDLINSGRYDTRDDFTAVIQPFFKDTVLPVTENGTVDASYFAPDCFHFSSKGHAMGALNIWNNMLEPVGTKTTKWSVSDLKCPTKQYPYIFTHLNSPSTHATHELTKRDVIDNCRYEECFVIPEWSIGVIVALVAVAAAQMMTLLFMFFIGGK